MHRAHQAYQHFHTPSSIKLVKLNSVKYEALKRKIDFNCSPSQKLNKHIK